jgi:hypothetical protein
MSLIAHSLTIRDHCYQGRGEGCFVSLVPIAGRSWLVNRPTTAPSLLALAYTASHPN